MKKACSILLISLVLMNTLGYYGFFLGMQYQNKVRLVNDFDRGEYDVSKVIVIKVPISIPYVHERSFERVDGTFEYNGEFFRLIKQGLHNDTLQIVCIKDQGQQKIHDELVRYTSSFTDHTGNNSDKSKSIGFIKDYLPQITNILHASEGWQRSMDRKTVTKQFSSPVDKMETPPPRQG